MEPQTALVLLAVALVGALALCAYLAWWANECRCDHCAFHKHARRVAAEEKRLHHEQVKKQQEQLAHEMAHKGQGYKDSDPDLYDCLDASCRRNRGRLEP